MSQNVFGLQKQNSQRRSAILRGPLDGFTTKRSSEGPRTIEDLYQLKTLRRHFIHRIPVEKFLSTKDLQQLFFGK